MEIRMGTAWLAFRIAEDKEWSVIVRLPSKVRGGLCSRRYICLANTDKENTSGRTDALLNGESINKFPTKFYYRSRIRFGIADEPFVRGGVGEEIAAVKRFNEAV